MGMQSAKWVLVKLIYKYNDKSQTFIDPKCQQMYCFQTILISPGLNNK